jgi:hypothetical protein
MKREDLFTKIITQVSQGNQEEYEALALEIEQRDEMQLCEAYQKVLDGLKDNPVEEKELADIIEKSAKQECSQFEVAAYVLGKDFLNATDMEQVALLIGKVSKKIMAYRDDKNVVKKTPSFENYEPMKPVDRMAFENLKLKLAKEDSDKEKSNEEIDKFISEATKINVKNLTVWEHGLLQEILQQEAKSISMIFLGKK